MPRHLDITAVDVDGKLVADTNADVLSESCWTSTPAAPQDILVNRNPDNPGVSMPIAVCCVRDGSVIGCRV